MVQIYMGALSNIYLVWTYEFREGAVTTSVGKSFHPSTTLLLKKCPLTRRRYRFLKIFSGCPLVGLLDIVNNKSLSTLSIPFRILCIQIMSAKKKEKKTYGD